MAKDEDDAVLRAEMIAAAARYRNIDISAAELNMDTLQSFAWSAVAAGLHRSSGTSTVGIARVR